MAEKIKTVKISGGAEYAKVADRLNEFRGKNPRASIKNSFQALENGDFVFTAEIVADLKDEFSGRANGTALMPAKKMQTEKGFEKGQTIAVGRALAFMGYASNGEVATSEEMEEFEEFKAEKFEESVLQAVELLEECENFAGLQSAWLAIPRDVKANPRVVEVKDKMKEKLSEVK